MSTSDNFRDFLSNIQITQEKSSQVSNRYQEITKALNIKFRDTDGRFVNCLQVGSYGRWTAIKGISDLDMLYIMPAYKWNEYNVSGGQSKLLKDTKEAILKKYPKTTVFIDRLVVCVQYTDFHVEVQPVFKQEDGSYKYPDTYKGGSWKVTKPQDELDEMKEMNRIKNRNLRRLCKMARSWKNKQGIAIGGLLVDTLAYNFLKSTNYFDDKSYLHYDLMCRDFFKFLSEEPTNKDHYQALGSNQDVKVKDNFIKSARKAYDWSLEAIEANNLNSSHKKWRNIFGRSFPNAPVVKAESLESRPYTFDNTEEFIDDQYPIDIRYKLTIDSEVIQNGYRENTLRNMLARGIKFRTKKKLNFFIADHNISGDFTIKWKVLNKGLEAERKNDIRGQIIDDKGYKTREEITNFNGEHIVECFAMQNGVVIARGIIDVPISME